VSYSVWCQPAGYVGKRFEIRVDSDNGFKPGENRANRNLVLSAARSVLFGQVVTPAGRPVTQVNLSLSARDGDFHHSLVDSSGRFRFEQVGDGPMTLIVQPRWGNVPASAAFRQKVRASDLPLRVVVK
jgi:hypothetical protein